MSSTAPKTTFTPEDLLAMRDGERFELVDGQLVERNMGSESSWVAGRIFLLISTFVEQHRLGWTWPADNGYQCFPDEPNKVRKPDASFIARGRLPDGRPSLGFETVPPDLAVEVISPNDIFYEVDAKVEEYLRAGVQLVWVVNPEARTIAVHRPDGTVTKLREDDELTGETVLPGFRCGVRDVFVP